MDAYDPQAIERKWQQVWDEADAFVTPNPADPAAAEADKAYVLEMLPYPSGDLHMGHVLNYTLGDVVSHVRRRRGWSVLRPMGYDAFGLNAENAAITRGRPSSRGDRAQYRRDPPADPSPGLVDRLEPRGLDARAGYYRWTQWLFLKLYEAGSPTARTRR